MCKRGSETDEETRSNEHTKVLSGGLENSTNENNGCTEENTGFAAKTVSNIWSNWDGAEGTNRLDGIEKTKILVRRITEIL